AENQKKCYIEKLFYRYGENGRLSFFGLERLLTNLGLGEIKVVEINHEDLGHDHVSHLDILAVQEGKHFHSHNHQHSHNHHDHNRRLHHHHRSHRRLDHNTTRHFHNDSITHSERGEPSHEPSTETNTTQEQREVKPQKQKKRRKGKKNDNPEVITPGFPSNHDQGEQYEHNRVHKPGSSASHKDLMEMTDKTLLNQNVVPMYRKQQRKDNKSSDSRKSLSFMHWSGQMVKIHECLNVTQLLRYYGHDTNSPISPDLFTCLCPALLYQIDSRLCILHPGVPNNAGTGKKVVDIQIPWICGIISITVISLLSLLGVILVPIINQGCFKFLLTFLVALAVGTMSGDALLHLLPHSQGGHDHSHQHAHGHGHSHGHESKKFLEEYDAVLKGLVALGGIYLLFIIEHCIRMFKHYKQQRVKNVKLKVKFEIVRSKKMFNKFNKHVQVPEISCKHGILTHFFLYLEGQQESPPKNYLCVEEEKIMDHSHSDGLHTIHEHDLHATAHNHHEESKTVLRKHNHQWHHKHSHHSHGPCHSGSDLKETGIANIAWMVIMGDGIHNFSDGLAIGAAFSAGLTGGISTSIAVFCHELPHELGDFAVLLKAGMTVKQAIVYNLLSAMMAYIGMLIGTAVGQYANNITLWIFAITAGMFLYVALVDMLPEMLHGDGDNEEHGFCPVGQFILQNLGLLLGFAIMLVIALYEDKIVLDIQF
uniref:Solute carrier family 39 member 10 n=1 Tax=Loxodonta africana TaxID=9785 RepID=G3T8G8_LOXAF